MMNIPIPIFIKLERHPVERKRLKGPTATGHTFCYMSYW